MSAATHDAASGLSVSATPVVAANHADGRLAVVDTDALDQPLAQNIDQDEEDDLDPEQFVDESLLSLE